MSTPRYFFLLSILLFVHCQSDTLLTKYAKSYQQLQRALIAADSLIDDTIDKKNLSPYQIIKFNNQKDIFCNQSLADWLVHSNRDEAKLIDLLDQTTSFLSAIEQNEFFTPDSMQRQQYILLQQKIISMEESPEWSNLKSDRKTPEILMIMDHDIELYLSKILINSKQFSEFLKEKLKDLEKLSSNYSGE